MLPVMELGLWADCKVRKDVFGSGENNVLAYTYAYDFEKIRDAVLRAGENLDTFLSRRILAGMSQNPVKENLLFFYAVSPDPQYVLISVSSYSMKAKCQWLLKLIDYCAFGEEFLRGNAQPFMYWDGKQLSRIYALPPKFSQHAKYICDLGSCMGLTVGKVPVARYREIAKDKTENWDYSVIPEDEQERIEVDGKECVLHHRFYTLLGGMAAV